MTDDNERAAIDLSRRKVLGSMAVIGAAGAGAGAGTWAWWSDQESIEGQTISAGTLEIDSVEVADFPVENVHPGMDPKTVEIDVSVGDYDIDTDVVMDIGVRTSGDLAGQLEGTFNWPDGDVSGTLDQLDGGAVQKELSAPGPGETATAELELEWDPEGDEETNEYQGTEMHITWAFKLRQVEAAALTTQDF